MLNGSDAGAPPAPAPAATTLVPTDSELNLPGLLLVTIPLITIVGNLLVILSVLRYRALQSAINYLILGLAVADLCVALFVMPYAVYVHVYRGMWQLGNLMCDIYTATDVACSTASILLLAVISFDRYRAVSKPIQYSRQSQNVRRVFAMIAGIWIISFALASPMVLGANVRPPDASPYECRFYNAEFSIGSSIISFVIPCILVLFVYMRIIVALKKREKAARMRRLKNAGLPLGSTTARSSEDGDEAGRIVAGPVVNVMMMALPSMSRHMRRFERHRQAIEAAGDDVDVEVDGAEPPAAALLRRVLRPGLLPASRSLSFAKEHEMAGSSSPRSSIDESLSENIHVITNDFVSEGYASQSRRSSTGDGSEPSQASIPERRIRKHKPNNYQSRPSKKSSEPVLRAGPSTESEQRGAIPAILRSISRRSPRLFRSISPKGYETAMIVSNPVAIRQLSQTETETISASKPDGPAVSRSTTANSEVLGSIEACDSPGTLVKEDGTEDESIKDDSQPTVTFALTVRNMAGSPEHRLKGSFDTPNEDSIAVQIMTRGSVSHIDNIMKPIVRMDSHDTVRSNDSQSVRRSRNGLAGKLVKKTLRHEQSLKRKVSKAQRKEKRATKTLGVVVGVFLVCWVPFFAINIVNAVCILAHKEFCQVGFDLFFYCTWIGYMNSFMNPIIYTIFNTEFRRAFKALLCGRNAARAHLLNKQVHL